ncbi:MAG: VWA domain-containing protein [Blastocatellia bacterium]|nr:VWA domain-containing protein [Blastocatellia bacterium]MBL8193631.1 VWA domain-containing protein [Blastocatellia bacterium]MBN8723739.1 VWA domain-containing protein [Acidobacteriota bacterium]
MRQVIFCLFIFLLLVLANTTQVSVAQSGRNSGNSTERSASLNVIIRSKTSESPNLTKDNLALFDGGIEQEIEYFRYDSTGARIIILADNSQSLRADPAVLQLITERIIKELRPEDRLMVIGYSEQAEVLADFTNNTKALNNASTKFTRSGLPKLYDALVASVADGFSKQLGANKRAIILISDGYDKDSKIKYQDALATLLNENILIYAFQAPDRSYGAIRPKDTGPKPVDAITNLAESTGGLLFKIGQLESFESDLKTLMSELKEGWFTLSYTPKGINLINSRRLLLTTPNDKLVVRTKKLHPPQVF